MFLPALLLFQPGPIATIDALAQKRDVKGLQGFMAQRLRENYPHVLDVLTSGGAYGTGRFGWRALPLSDPQTKKQYVVFTTKLTSEDIGELLFEFSNGKLVNYLSEDDSFGVVLDHHDFDVKFDLARKEASFVDRVHFQRIAIAASSFLVRFGPNFKVTDVRDSRNKPVKFSQGGGVVFLPARGSEKTFTYTFTYSGVVDLPQYAGSISSKEVLLTQDYWYPMIARRPASFNIKAHVPSSWIVVSQGQKTQDEVNGEERTTAYRMDLPIVYFSLSAASFPFTKNTIGARDYYTWSMHEPEDMRRVQNTLNAEVVEFYNKTFSPYPFKSWGALISDVYGGGALEAYSYATYGTGMLPGQDAHEPSHTWWGGIIPNTYLHSFWNESFANYSSGLFERESERGNRGEKRLAFIADETPSPDYKNAAVESTGVFGGPVASSLGYGKGAQVLQMLQDEIGTDLMTRAMRQWLRVHPKGEPGEWPEFERIVNEVNGKNYGWFFEQWLRRSGWADFNVSSVQYSNGRVTGKVAFKGPAYRLNLELLLVTESGDVQVRHVQVPATRSSTFSVAVSNKPKLVSVDPYFRILRMRDPNEVPNSLGRFLGSAKAYVEPAHKDWLQPVVGEKPKVDALPSNLNGLLVVGSPETNEVVRTLCRKCGFVVSGNHLTYDGTTIDLNKGGAMALVDLGNGSRCAVGLGKVLLAPQTGHSHLAVVDGYGRFLRGKTHPKTSGAMTFKL